VREPLGSRLLFPITERSFTYRSYAAFLDQLVATERFQIVPLAELAEAPRGRPTISLRHDVDSRLESALQLAVREHERGVRATYFVLHTADYFAAGGEELITALKLLQDTYGHEIGWHNDLVTLQCVHGIDPVPYLLRELERLRAAGIRIRGVAAHGDPHCYRLGYHNSYAFEDASPVPGFPHTDVVPTPAGPCRIHKAKLAEAGFEYDAYTLPYGRYFSDSSFDERGRRWHPDHFDFDTLAAGERAVVLTHPCHWDRNGPAKSLRLVSRIVRRLARLGG
jgi:hypothetical protein